MGLLSQLPNIGKVLASQLNAVGILTAEQLRETGSKAAWAGIRAIDPSACLNRLYALEGAIQGIRWHDLDDGVKADLKAYYRTFE